jgi:hypothetical protein
VGRIIPRIHAEKGRRFRKEGFLMSKDNLEKVIVQTENGLNTVLKALKGCRLNSTQAQLFQKLQS